MVKNGNTEQHHRIQHIQMDLDTKFHLSFTFNFFEINLPKICIFELKQKKNDHHHRIQHIWNSHATNFCHNWLFVPNLSWREFLAQSIKGEHQHWIQHIRMSFGTKMQHIHKSHGNKFISNGQFWLIGPNFSEKSTTGLK